MTCFIITIYDKTHISKLSSECCEYVKYRLKEHGKLPAITRYLCCLSMEDHGSPWLTMVYIAFIVIIAFKKFYKMMNIDNANHMNIPNFQCYTISFQL